MMQSTSHSFNPPDYSCGLKGMKKRAGAGRIREDLITKKKKRKKKKKEEMPTRQGDHEAQHHGTTQKKDFKDALTFLCGG